MGAGGCAWCTVTPVTEVSHKRSKKEKPALQTVSDTHSHELGLFPSTTPWKALCSPVLYSDCPLPSHGVFLPTFKLCFWKNWVFPLPVSLVGGDVNMDFNFIVNVRPVWMSFLRVGSKASVVARTGPLRCPWYPRAACGLCTIAQG